MACIGNEMKCEVRSAKCGVRERAFAVLSHFALLTSSFLLAGCAASNQSVLPLHRFEFAGPHMGTLFSITLYAPDPTNAGTAARAAFARVAELENVMSDYDADSELSRLGRQPVGRPV